MRRLGWLLLAALVLLPSSAFAAFPERPATLVVPFSPGGSTDLDGRAFAQIASKYLGQPVVVANREGGSGIIGSQFVNKSKPDGYTVLCGRPGAQGVATACFPDTTPFSLDSFTFLGIIDSTPLVLLVHPDAPYKTLQELIATIKANPGKLKYSSSGVSSIHNFGTQLMLNLAGLKPDALVHVPYKGGGEALTAIMGGQVDMMMCAYNEGSGHIKGKTLRPLVITSPEPFPFAPEVPSAKQAGMPDLDIHTWFVLLGPKGLSKDVQDTWWNVIQKVVVDEDWKRMVAELGCIATPMNPEEAKAYVVRQNAMLRRVGEAMGVVK